VKAHFVFELRLWVGDTECYKFLDAQSGAPYIIPCEQFWGGSYGRKLLEDKRRIRRAAMQMRAAQKHGPNNFDPR
jgi:hypothetical protein